jgi:hypothetical protein
MPAERPGTLPGRSSCVPCGRSLRQSSPGDAPMMHHSPARSLCTTTELEGFRRDAAPVLLVTVTSTLVSVSRKQKSHPLLTNAPVVSVETRKPTSSKLLGENTLVTINV